MIGVPAGSGSRLDISAESVAHLITGPLATSIAVISVALIGYMTISGRLPIRRGITVIAGCFIVFGSAEIARGLLGLAVNAKLGTSAATPPPATSTFVPVPPSPSRPPNYDPYAGAAVPAS